MFQRFVVKPLLKLAIWLAKKLFVPVAIWLLAKISLDRWHFRRCESCAEKIRRKAVVCRHCGHRSMRKSGSSSKWYEQVPSILHDVRASLHQVLARSGTPSL